VHGNVGFSRDKLCVAMRLVLIRHAPVEIQPEVPAEQWVLSAAGARAATALCGCLALQSVAVIASSPEPKATATAVAIANGKPIVEMDDLTELDRSAAGWLRTRAEYICLVGEILQQPQRSVRGCEPAAHAQQRFVKAVEELHVQFDGVEVAVVSHGIVLSLYMAYIRHLPTSDLTIWKSIGLPDLAIVDPLQRKVLVDFGARGYRKFAK
jgi:broad specificity phosphatase PhoE